MTEYLAGGGDGFAIIAKNKEKHLQVPNTISSPLPTRGSTQREALATQREKSIPHVTLINL